MSFLAYVIQKIKRTTRFQFNYLAETGSEKWYHLGITSEFSNYRMPGSCKMMQVADLIWEETP